MTAGLLQGVPSTDKKIMTSDLISFAQKGAEAQEQGRLQEALGFYRQALEIDPTLPRLASNVGVVLTDLGEFTKAEELFEEAIALEPENYAVWNNRGNLWKKQQKWSWAIEDYSHAISLKEDYFHAIYNRGSVYFALDRLVDSERDLQKAVALNPLDSKPWVNLGEVAWELNRPDEALTYFERAIQADGENAEGHWNRALWYLWRGDYLKGWSEYEWRWALPGIPEFYPEIAAWRGEREGHLLVYAEQGFGDTIQFSRFLKETRSRVRAMTVDVQGGLLLWLREFYPEIDFVESSQIPKTVTHRVALQSLPLVLGIGKPPTFPIESKSSSSEGVQRVAFCWSGSGVDLRRRIPLELWNPLFQIQGKEWISFQTGNAVQELKRENPLIFDLGSGFQNFKETAEGLAKVDLVVTIDTALAHLAGTIGKPTLLLLPQVADWRWGAEGESCDWYPSVRCFRQRSRGDWAEVLARVGAELQQGGL